MKSEYAEQDKIDYLINKIKYIHFLFIQILKN